MRGFLSSMYKILVVLIATISFASCSPIFRYDLVKPSEVKNIHPDSLKWKYTNGVLTKMPVRDKEDGLFWLDVNDKIFLDVETIENDKYSFRMQTLTASDEKESGLLGSNAMWRGYDTRNGAERTVYVREVRTVKVVSYSRPSLQRILPN